MGLTNRNKKRILIFALIPVLSSVQIITDDFILRVIAAVLTVVYVAFIIFLRDSVREDPFENNEEVGFSAVDEGENIENDSYETDAGEDFTIVSPNKTIEVARSSKSFAANVAIKGKNFFKPRDLKEAFSKIATEEFPSGISHNEQFTFVLEKILTVIKDAFLAHTSVFFWYNKKTNRLTLEQFVSSSDEITPQKFEIEDDILSKIVQKEEPELLTDINATAEQDVIRYYHSPQGIKSFVGVPLFYGKQLMGVLALDSKSTDDFGIETIYSLGRFVRVISIIIALYEEKYTETQSEQRLKALLEILNNDKKFDVLEELNLTIENTIRDLIHWDVFAFVNYNATEQKFRTSKIVNKTSLKYVGENLEVEINGTLVGKAIIGGVPVNQNTSMTPKPIRYSSSEDVSLDGSFLAIPLVYDDQNYGVLCFESLKENFYSNNDIKFLENATKVFAFILYSYSTQSMLRSLLSVDVDTKAFNYDSFVDTLTKDLVKAKEFKAPGALAIIRIDDFLEQDTLFESNPFPKVLKSIHQMIKEEMTPLNIFGRLDKKIFAIYFFNQTTKNVFLWAEKLRIKIARKPIAVATKQTTFTVSIGVASTSNKTDVEEVLKDAELALNKAIEKGGNTVKSIN